MKNLRVDNPCPMLLMKMSKDGDNFTCKSCKKQVVDFRGKSQEEIASAITENTCGIFTNDQLPGQQRMPFFRQAVFYALTVLSFLGFQVSPLNAAPKPARNSGTFEFNQTAPKQEKEKDKKKKKKKSKKKQTFRTVGTPSF